MFEHRELLEMLAHSTQEECRELGKLFLSMADAPRDVHWKAGFAEKLAAMPIPPKETLPGQLQLSRARVAQENDELWKAGWHPRQMRQELEARGYEGVSPTPPSVS